MPVRNRIAKKMVGEEGMEVAEFSVLWLFPTRCLMQSKSRLSTLEGLSTPRHAGRARAYPAYLPYHKDVTPKPPLT